MSGESKRKIDGLIWVLHPDETDVAESLIDINMSNIYDILNQASKHDLAKILSQLTNDQKYWVLEALVE